MEDRRDIRDPKALGEWILLRKVMNKEKHVCDIADNTFQEDAQIPDYARDESTVQSTMAQYKAEMIEEAGKGEAAARIVCAEHGWAYGQACIATNGSEHRADEASEDVEDLPEYMRHMALRQCRKQAPHLPHIWTVVPQPGVRAPVIEYRCKGLKYKIRS